nr:MAG TPA: hypothetical protein [Caudoviricetes sp.]
MRCFTSHVCSDFQTNLCYNIDIGNCDHKMWSLFYWKKL